MNPKGFFEEPFMNTHGSIKNPKWFFAAPNLWFRRTLQGSFKEPHVRVLKMVLSKEPSKRALCSTFWGCQYRDSPKNPKRCHLTRTFTSKSAYPGADATLVAKVLHWRSIPITGDKIGIILHLNTAPNYLPAHPTIFCSDQVCEWG